MTLFLRACFYASLFVLCSCEQKPNVTAFQNSPEDALRAFQQALNRTDLKTAFALGSEGSRRQLQLLGVYLNMSSEEEISAKKKEISAEIKSLNCTQKENNTDCRLCCTADGKEKTATLLQHNGKWFVDMHLGMQDKPEKNK